MFDDKLNERDSQGLSSRADKRSWAHGVVASVVLHLAIVAALLVSAVREGSVTVIRHPDEPASFTSQVTLLPSPGSMPGSPTTNPAVKPSAVETQSSIPHETAAISAARPGVQTSPMPEVFRPTVAPTAAQMAPVAADTTNTVAIAAPGSDYRRRLREHVAANKKTPPPGTPPGTVYVRFSVDRAGSVLSVAIAVSSGDAVLDRTAIDSIHDANPMPPIPPAFPDRLTVMVPIDFGSGDAAKALARP